MLPHVARVPHDPYFDMIYCVSEVYHTDGYLHECANQASQNDESGTDVIRQRGWNNAFFSRVSQIFTLNRIAERNHCLKNRNERDETSFRKCHLKCQAQQPEPKPEKASTV